MRPATGPRARRSDARLLVLPALEDGSPPGSRETRPMTIADLPRYLQAGDLLVLNDVSGGAVFGAADNAVTIVDSTGVVGEAAGDKNLIAHRILDAVVHTKGTTR